MNNKQFQIQIYSDGAEIKKMQESFQTGFVSGFTTNPSLMKAAGIKDYVSFSKEAVSNFPLLPISFEVFADDFATMEQEARKIATFGKNVYVKIPVTNAKGESSAPLIKKLSQDGIQLNITAITTAKQVKEVVEVFQAGTSNIVSVFVGRLADSGIDPIQFVKESRQICDTKAGTLLLWASTREVFNIYEAERLGCDIITVPPQIISKLSGIGTTPEEISLNTIQTFQEDIQQLGFRIL
ncbi:transaldolase [Isobaculum melis]|uniref:Transaldolase n=1 Tax=Isobaculum melis TaxID=142588 RepID=A0A1H9TQE4_9LACT|nr:transaldolase [Isobaculum melis]SER99366.1 transaldolase [Isobaculum melis]